jgi:hypothetical protein
MDQNQMMLDYLMQMGDLAPEQEAILRKRAMVDQLRQGGGRTPQMRGGGSGFQTAAHPLEFLSQVAHQGLGQMREGEANTQQDAYGAARRQKLKDLQARMYPPQPEQPEQLSGPGMTGY